MDRTPHITEHPHSQTVRTHHSCLHHLCQLRHHQIIIFLINKLFLPSLSSWMILTAECFPGTKERTPDPKLHGRWESRTKHNLVREQKWAIWIHGMGFLHMNYSLTTWAFLNNCFCRYKDGYEVLTAPSNPKSHRVILPTGSLFFLRVMQNKKEDVSWQYIFWWSVFLFWS